MCFSGVRNDSSVGICSLTRGSTWWRWIEISWDRPKNHFWLHHNTMMSLLVGLKKTRLILLEDHLVLLVCLGSPGSRWMFWDPDLPQKLLTVPSATGNMNFSPFIGVNTSFALSLRAWSSDASISSNSSMSATGMSPFQILSGVLCTSKEFMWQDFWTKLM